MSATSGLNVLLYNLFIFRCFIVTLQQSTKSFWDWVCHSWYGPYTQPELNLLTNSNIRLMDNTLTSCIRARISVTICCTGITHQTQRRHNAGWMLGQRLRRCLSIHPALRSSHTLLDQAIMLMDVYVMDASWMDGESWHAHPVGSVLSRHDLFAQAGGRICIKTAPLI